MSWLSFRNPKRRAGRFHRRLWLAYVLVGLTIVGIDVYSLLEFREHFAAHVKAQAAQDKKMNDLLQPVYEHTRPLLSQDFLHSRFRYRSNSMMSHLMQFVIAAPPFKQRRVSKAAVEKILNSGQPFTSLSHPWKTGQSNSAPQSEDLLFTPPDGSITISLHFKNGFFEYASRLRLPREFKVPFKGWRELGKRVRKLTLQAWKLWGLVLIVAVLSTRYRFLAVELVLMISIATLVSHLPSPAALYYSSNLELGKQVPWDITMLSASLTALSWVYFAQRSGSRVRCLNCDYNLTGNSSGVCPECGWEIPAETRHRLTAASE